MPEETMKTQTPRNPGGRAQLVLQAAAATGAVLLSFSAFAQDNPEWRKIVDAAKAERTVTIYSSQGQKQLNDLAKRFKDKHGINVQVVRAVETDLWPKVDVEHQTGKGIADVMVAAGMGLVIERNKQGYAMKSVGPAFDNPVYGRAKRAPEGTYFETSATILTFSWNTELWPQGIKDYPDILNPALKGKIGVPQARTPGQVDFYLYLMRHYGDDFMERLAALEPRIYPGALPQAQAVASGEIAVALHAEPLIDEKEAGAPVEWGIAPKPFGARFYGMVLKSAPHPNAAQLLANFMVTPDGQEAIARKAGAVLPDVEGSVASTVNVPEQDLSKLTSEFVQKFSEKWNALFQRQ
jgi:iron(III) transport system substrate-binding protein